MTTGANLKSGSGILAIFKYLDQLTSTMERIGNDERFAGHEVFSPTSYHEIEHAAHFAPSPVRVWTLCGALTGTCTGFALTLGLDYEWPIVVGGKMGGVASLPAYVVIGFELTILLGALATICGMLVHCRLPNPKTTILDNRLTDDRFGIWVPHVGSDSPQAKLLREMGAEEVKVCHA
jgi:hypothetical protein